MLWAPRIPGNISAGATTQIASSVLASKKRRPAGSMASLICSPALTRTDGSTLATMPAPSHLTSRMTSEPSCSETSAVAARTLSALSALDGTSLTVNEVSRTSYGVNLIPHTLAVTTWGGKQVGDRINLEIDPIARYMARLLEFKT